MRANRSIRFIMPAFVCFSCASAAGCFDIDDYIHINREDPTKGGETNDGGKTDGDSSDPFDGGDSDSENKHNGGSGGLIENPDKDAETGGKIEDPAVLSIETLAPARGSVRGGYEIRVIGTALSDGGALWFGQTQSPRLRYVHSQVVRAAVPPGRAGCVDVAWEQDGARIELPQAFCYEDDLSVTKIEPSAAVGGETVPVAVYGAGFDAQTRIAFVLQNDSGDAAQTGAVARRLYDLRLVSDEKIAGELPDLPPGVYDVIAAGTRGAAAARAQLTVVPKLSVAQISPSYAEIGQKTDFVISGTGFGGKTRVKIGAETVGAAIAGDGKMTVSYAGAEKGCRDVLIYDDYSQQRLDCAIYIADDDDSGKILSVAPDVGSTLGGDVVTVSGVRLANAGDAFFGDAAAKTLARNADAWTIAAPPHAEGAADVAIASSILKNAYAYVQYPTLQSAVPAAGSKSTAVTLTGTGFSDGLRVFFGSREAASVSVQSPTQAQAVAPDGDGTVALKLVQNRAEVQSDLSFAYGRNVEIVGQSTQEAVTSGGTSVAIYGSGFGADLVLRVGGQETPHALISALEMRFVAPPREAGAADIELICPENPQAPCAKTSIEYFDPKTNMTGASGGGIDGSIYVSVFEAKTGDPIENATVYIGTDENGLSEATDAAGRVLFEDPGLKGSQIVIACAENHACNSMQPVNARYITLYLEKWSSGAGASEEITPPPPTPDDGGTINPIDITIPYTPKPAYFTGTVGDFGKVDLETNPNHIRAGLVMQSALSAYRYPYQDDDVYLLTEPGQTYKIRARSGEAAVALLCGIYNTETKSFAPRYLGIKRHLMASDGAVIENHLDCDLPLTQNLRVKLLNAPLKSGPNIVNASAFLNLGSDGYIGGFMNGVSQTDLVVLTGLPPLNGAIDDADFTLQVGAYTNGHYPATIFSAENIVHTSETLEVGPAVPIPVFATQSETDIFASGIVEWRVEYPQNVDYYVVIMRMYSSSQSGDVVFQAYLPGSATSVELPPALQWPSDNSGQLYIQLYAYKSVRSGFDFDIFTTSELRYNYVHSSAYATLAVSQRSAVQTTP